MEKQLRDQSPDNKSPRLPTNASNSTAQNTVMKNQISTVLEGPSKEDSKFLMESSMGHGSISVPQDSRISAGNDTSDVGMRIRQANRENYERLMQQAPNAVHEDTLYQQDNHVISQELEDSIGNASVATPGKIKEQLEEGDSNGPESRTAILDSQKNVSHPQSKGASFVVTNRSQNQGELQDDSTSSAPKSHGGRRTKKKGKKSKKEESERTVYPIHNFTIDNIIYPVQTKKGLKWGKGRRPKSIEMDKVNQQTEKVGRLLDGFLILFSCRVKLPHEAIKSKLGSQRIVDVIEEDLCYFQNLISLDLSDNKVRMEQLKNLHYLQDLNLQFNHIQYLPPLADKDFQNLEVLNLSYNQIPFDNLRSLYNCVNLKTLDLSANSLEMLPEDLHRLHNLEELNLSSNQFSSVSGTANQIATFKTLGLIKKLKRLNLSRNQFAKFHHEMLDLNSDFVQLQELDLSYNIIESERHIWALTMTKSVNVVIISGNPFAVPVKGGVTLYQNFEHEIGKNLSAVVINDSHMVTGKPGPKNKKSFKNNNLPYPNPIKLFSREVQKEIKGDYLNAEVMRQGIALPISEIRPNTNIESEIFPRELTKEAQAKEVFTPPNHGQMRFVGPEEANKDQDDANFFITEAEHMKSSMQADAIQEEKSYGSEQDKTESKRGQFDQEQQDLFEADMEAEAADDDDEVFDFGKAKMDFFKQRARQILVEQMTPEQIAIIQEYGQSEDDDMAYEGKPLPLKHCYQQLKNLIKRPVVTYNNSAAADKPHYMKMTFAMSRSVAPSSKILQLSSLMGNISKLKGDNSASSALLNKSDASSADLTLLKQLKGPESKKGALTGGMHRQKSKREEVIDQKIEKLLIAYKKTDEEAQRKAVNMEVDQVKGKKNLMEKFGFSDDEDVNFLA